MTVKLVLTVNGVGISVDYFVEAFIDHTVSGMIEALEDTGKIQDLSLAIDGDKVTINLNGVSVPTNNFASRLIRNTIIGMVSSLKDVDYIKKLSISINK